MDLDALRREGHHPKFYVKAVQSSLDAMKEIQGHRKRAREAYEKFDRAIWKFSTAKYNVEVSYDLNLAFYTIYIYIYL